VDNNLYVTWEEYIVLLEKIKKYVGMTNNQVIVGLARGGLIPAVYLSHALQLPMISFDPYLLRPDGRERTSISLPISPIISKKILLVDDILDTGETFVKCTKFFQDKGFICTTVSVFYNMSTKISDENKVNFTAAETPNKWVVFPYENTKREHF